MSLRAESDIDVRRLGAYTLVDVMRFCLNAGTVNVDRCAGMKVAKQTEINARSRQSFDARSPPSTFGTCHRTFGLAILPTGICERPVPGISVAGASLII